MRHEVVKISTFETKDLVIPKKEILILLLVNKIYLHKVFEDFPKTNK